MKTSLTIIALLSAVIFGISLRYAPYSSFLEFASDLRDMFPMLAKEQDQPKPSDAIVYNPGDTFHDCEDSPLMVVVPAGSFMMGSPETEDDRDDDEGPVHKVTIEKPFAVGVYEVTFEEWDACVSASGCGYYAPDDVVFLKWWGRERFPVVNVGWDDAQGYVDWLSDKTGKTYRLLSESEWEYVARAGTTGRYHWGNRISSSKANYGNKVGKTMPVGSYPRNPFGLYDVHGNVGEWVGGCWNPNYSGAPSDGSVWGTGDCTNSVFRGGSWRSKPRHLRSAYRGKSPTMNRSIYVGFRVAMTLDSLRFPRSSCHVNDNHQ